MIDTHNATLSICLFDRFFTMNEGHSEEEDVASPEALAALDNLELERYICSMDVDNGGGIVLSFGWHAATDFKFGITGTGNVCYFLDHPTLPQGCTMFNMNDPLVREHLNSALK
jgi:hypothetical protein